MADQDSGKESEQLALMRRLVEMSAQRSVMSAERTYMNAERTLSVWVRTALGVMILGLAVDRFRLVLFELPKGVEPVGRYSSAISNWVGIALVAAGVLMALVTGLRFSLYAAAYRRQHKPPYYHAPNLAPFFAAMVVVFGIALLVILIVAGG